MTRREAVITTAFLISEKEQEMKNTNTMPHGISVIYFNEPHRNIYAKPPPDREQAKRLAKRIYKDAMTAVAGEKANVKLLCQAIAG
ncbi:MAG: hypothetical protein FWE53_01650 [Firmicutes bacterium]|nr:hypothetical protein [Bacillota bacterium]